MKKQISRYLCHQIIRNRMKINFLMSKLLPNVFALENVGERKK